MLDFTDASGKIKMSTSDDGKDTILTQETFDMFTKNMSEKEIEDFRKNRNCTFSIKGE